MITTPGKGYASFTAFIFYIILKKIYYIKLLTYTLMQQTNFKMWCKRTVSIFPSMLYYGTLFRVVDVQYRTLKLAGALKLPYIFAHFQTQLICMSQISIKIMSRKLQVQRLYPVNYEPKQEREIKAQRVKWSEKPPQCKTGSNLVSSQFTAPPTASSTEKDLPMQTWCPRRQYVKVLLFCLKHRVSRLIFIRYFYGFKCSTDTLTRLIQELWLSVKHNYETVRRKLLWTSSCHLNKRRALSNHLTM